MSRKYGDSLPPPYTDAYTERIASPSRGHTILDQLTLSRAHNIQSVINTHIIPLVEQQARYGIAHTTIAMIPSDIALPAIEEKSEFSFDTNDSKPVEVIGFSSEAEPKVVRLEGQMNRTEFWRPQAVIVDLERVLRRSLNASSTLRSPTSPTRTNAFERREFDFSQQQKQQPKRSLLSRIAPSLGPEQRSPSENPEVGVKQVESVGLVLVKARLEEISLRTVNEFGLYETTSKQCIIIRVDARC